MEGVYEWDVNIPMSGILYMYYIGSPPCWAYQCFPLLPDSICRMEGAAAKEAAPAHCGQKIRHKKHSKKNINCGIVVSFTDISIKVV